METLKSLRSAILNELTKHNAIDEIDRSAQWHTEFNDLQTKYQDLTDMITRATAAAAAPALVPEQRTNAMRVDVPKLDSKDPHANWPMWKAHFLAVLAANSYVLPAPGPLTPTQEATIYGWLMTAVTDAGRGHLIMNDNPAMLGTKAWANLCGEFDNTSRATITMLLNQLMSCPRSAFPDLDFDKWLGNMMALYARILNIKDIKLEDVLLAICVSHLPSTPDYLNLKTALLDKSDLTKVTFFSGRWRFPAQPIRAHGVRPRARSFAARRRRGAGRVPARPAPRPRVPRRRRGSWRRIGGGAAGRERGAGRGGAPGLVRRSW
jgi:hypothetical protein